MRLVRKSNGFTLVELLTVVAVVALLASLLLPSLASARVAAHNTVCRNNLRQLALGVSLYTVDHEHYPKHSFTPASPSAGGFQIAMFGKPTRWSDAIFPHTQAKWEGDLYKCPAYTGTTWVDFANPASAYGSYGYNSFGTAGNGLDLLAGGWLKESAVASPADMVAIGDAQIGVYRHLISNGIAVGLNGTKFAYPEQEPGEDSVLVKKVRTARHRGRVNMVFADAHVEHGRTDKFHGRPELAKRWRHDHQDE
jgi:prepilin-type N-terminal cleavage/methylation domain-containing protein/prepilin-type processing-associated H-X9-DG protein